jgi:hypothetical protein
MLRYVCLYLQIYKLFRNFKGVWYQEVILSFVDISNFIQNQKAMGTLHEDLNASFFTNLMKTTHQLLKTCTGHLWCEDDGRKFLEMSAAFCHNSRRFIPEDSILSGHPLPPDNLNCHLLIVEELPEKNKKAYNVQHIFQNLLRVLRQLKETKTSQWCQDPVSYPAIRTDCW